MLERKYGQFMRYLSASQASYQFLYKINVEAIFMKIQKSVNKIKIWQFLTKLYTPGRLKHELWVVVDKKALAYVKMCKT
jgi:hypothetical protein